MGGDANTERESVERMRLERLIQALGFASVGSFEQAAGVIGAVQEDRFGTAEEALAVFVEELRSAHVERAAAMAALQASMTALEASRQDLEEKLATIQHQQATIRDLSAPMIEVWDRIVTLPFVGVMDGARASEVTGRLLQRISDHGDQCVILDLTGIEAIDPQTADHLLRLIRGAELLGAFCVLTGLRAALATTLVELGVDLGRVTTLRTLKEGLRACLAHLRGAGRSAPPM